MMRILFMLALTVMALPAKAQVYGELSRTNVTKTLLRFGAIQQSDDQVVNDYLKLTQCAKYRKSSVDDFAMRQWRDETRKLFKKDSGLYPDSYYFKAKAYLDKYDFTAKSYPLTEKSQLKNVNSFQLILAQDNDKCDPASPIMALPSNIGAVLDQPVYLTHIPMDEIKAQMLLKRMNESGNTNREIHVRFSLMMVYAPPYQKELGMQRYNMDAQLLAIEFFEDEKLTKPIWVFTRT